MSRSKLILFIAFFTAGSGYAQSFKPIGSGIKSSLHTLTFYDRYGWAVSYGSGNLYHSMDKGRTWRELWSSDSAYYEEIQFTSKKSGYLVGENGNLLYTKDGGKSWHNQLPEQLKEKKLLIYGAYFVDSKNGLVSCQPGNLQGASYNLLLEEGTWRILSDSVHAFLKIKSFDRDRLLGSTATEIMTFDKELKTVNVLYKRSSNAIGPIRDIGSVGNFVYAIGFRGYFIYSLDAGATWKEVAVSTTRIRSVLFVDARKGYIVGDQGLILETNDSGLTWARQETSLKEDLHRIVRHGSTVWICGKGGVLLTQEIK